MANVKVILDTRSQKSDKTHPLKLAVSHRGTSFINLGISLLEWNGVSVVDHPKAKIYNQVIKNRLTQAESILIELNSSGRLSGMNHSAIKKLIENKPEKEVKKNSNLMSDHFCKYIANCKAKRTGEIYQETLDKVNAFSPGASFEEVNLSWLRSFDTYLAKSCKTNTRAIHMRNIRAVFNDAINEDIVSLNLYPFRKFKIKNERTIKHTLTIDQIKQFRDYPVEKHQERYRDLFMLIFYLIGINLVDLLWLRHEDYRNGRIEYIRAKTGRPYSIEVLPEASKIIEKYKGLDYLLDVLDTYKNYKDFGARMNENLKEIGSQTRTGRGGKITRVPMFPDLIIYTARRSWATIASGLDIQKDTIAAALGHGGNTVTDLYIRFDLKKVDEANRKVLAAII